MISNDINEKFTKFKQIISPDNEVYFQLGSQDEEFKLLCTFFRENKLKLYSNGKYFSNFESETLYFFAYTTIRALIHSQRGYLGIVTWEERRMFIQSLTFEGDNYIDKSIVDIISPVLLGQATPENIECMLEKIGNYIEHILKPNNNSKYSNLKYSISDEIKNIIYSNDVDTYIKNYKKKIQCFRHHTMESIEERTSLTFVEKKILLYNGYSICILLDNESNNSHLK